MYLLDIAVLSEPRKRRRAPRPVEWLGRVRPTRLHLSVVTIGEVKKGIGAPD